jgi:hypothetical protein
MPSRWDIFGRNLRFKNRILEWKLRSFPVTLFASLKIEICLSPKSCNFVMAPSSRRLLLVLARAKVFCLTLQLGPPDGGVGAPKATLYQQGDCDEAGWGPFGRSAFLLLEGEIRLTVVLEGQDELPKEVMTPRLIPAADMNGRRGKSVCHGRGWCVQLSSQHLQTLKPKHRTGR